MRQRRDKTSKPKSGRPAASQDPEDDPALIKLKHQHIPRDAQGDPVFLILPKGLRARYDEWMGNLEAFWKATEDPIAVSEAHTLTLIYRQVSPLWLDEAIYRLADQRRSKNHPKRVREAVIRSSRYMAVRDAKKRGLTWPEAYEAAERSCASNSATAGTWETMRRAYMDVKADLKAGRGGLYFLPHEQNPAAREAMKAGRSLVKEGRDATRLKEAERKASTRPKKEKAGTGTTRRTRT